MRLRDTLERLDGPRFYEMHDYDYPEIAVEAIENCRDDVKVIWVEEIKIENKCYRNGQPCDFLTFDGCVKHRYPSRRLGWVCALYEELRTK